MANRTLRRPSKKPTEPLVCDMFLNYDLTRLDSAQLTIEFIKFLCLQKGQIPVPFPQLQKLSYLAQKKLDTSNEFLVNLLSLNTNYFIVFEIDNPKIMNILPLNLI